MNGNEKTKSKLLEYRINIKKPMETGGGEPQKRLANSKKRMMPADNSITMRITKIWYPKLLPYFVT